MFVQVADLNRGAFGFVQLAKDVTTGEQVAIKFIERGEKARQQSHVTRDHTPLKRRPWQDSGLQCLDRWREYHTCMLCVVQGNSVT